MSPVRDEIVWASLPIPALIVDGENRIVAVNVPAEAFLNASLRVLEGQPVGERLNADSVLEDSLDRARERGSALFLNDVGLGTSERAPVLCSVQIAPLSNDGSHLMMLIESREVAGRLGRAMQVKSAAKSAIGMAEMLAHEIKNPLAGITGAAQLLSMGLQGDDRELTELIVAETRRILLLLEQVEQFGNLRPPAQDAVNIHDVLDRARRSAVLGFAAHITFREEYDPSLPACRGDSNQLLQVVLNLIRNAAEACRDGGTIRLRTFYEMSLRVRQSDGQQKGLPLQIEIVDDGPGIPPDMADAIFEPFVSGRENGTGLGLALVSKIISDHGGWIGVESAPGRTAFRISLPVASAPQDNPETP
ncbi:MAG: PAS domain-containing sensor histidine kinase [Rhodobacteraceae bacterium]|nr:PAS domain-containing sensor histidine kinase [Paracoccaceae bacterium]